MRGHNTSDNKNKQIDLANRLNDLIYYLDEHTTHIIRHYDHNIRANSLVSGSIAAKLIKSETYSIYVHGQWEKNYDHQLKSTIPRPSRIWFNLYKLFGLYFNFVWFNQANSKFIDLSQTMSVIPNKWRRGWKNQFENTLSIFL